MHTWRRFLVLAFFVLSLSVLVAQRGSPDWPQFRGPNRDGSVAAFTEPKTWPDRLTKKWTVNVGEGYATPLVVGDRLFMFTRQGAN
jgi:hypothetical protein